MSPSFREIHGAAIVRSYEEALEGIPVTWEPMRRSRRGRRWWSASYATGDTTRFGNILIES